MAGRKVSLGTREAGWALIGVVQEDQRRGPLCARSTQERREPMAGYMSEKIWPKGVRWGGAGLVSRGRVARIGRDAERVVRVFDT